MFLCDPRITGTGVRPLAFTLVALRTRGRFTGSGMDETLADITLLVGPGRTGTSLETRHGLFQKLVVLGSGSLVFFLRSRCGSGAEGEADRGDGSPLLDRFPLIAKAGFAGYVLVGFFQNITPEIRIPLEGGGNIEHLKQIRQANDRFWEAGPTLENLEKPLAVGTRKKQELHEAVLREMALKAQIVLFEARIEASSDTAGL